MFALLLLLLLHDVFPDVAYSYVAVSNINSNTNTAATRPSIQ